MNILKNKNKGFTIIELLVVISIISFLASIVLVNVNMYMAKARDAKRMSDMRQIMIALEMYRSQNGVYPNAINDGCGGWDTGNKDYIFLNTQLAGIMNNTPRDSVGTGSCSGYLYYRYPETDSVYYGCGGVPFYVLGVTNMETVSTTFPGSPGFGCSGRNWQNEFEWVTGVYEK